MATLLQPYEPYDLDGVPTYLYNTGNGNIGVFNYGGLAGSQFLTFLGKTAIAPNIPLFVDNEYENRDKLVREQQHFDEDANKWVSRFYVRVGAELYRNGRQFKSRQEGWLDEIYPNGDVAPYHQGLSADAISTGNMMTNASTLLESTLASIHSEHGDATQALEHRDRVLYGVLDDRGLDTGSEKLKDASRENQFGVHMNNRRNHASLAKSTNIVSKDEAKDAIDSWTASHQDKWLYYGEGHMHDIIRELKNTARMAGNPNVESDRALGFIVRTLNDDINRHLPDTLPSRNARVAPKISRPETNFTLIHQAVLNVLVVDAIQVPTLEGSLRNYHLPVGADSVAGLTRDAHAEYDRLRAEADEAMGTETKECGLMASLPDLDYSKAS